MITLENLTKDASARLLDMQAGNNEMKIEFNLDIFEGSTVNSRSSVRIICHNKLIVYDAMQIKAKLHKKQRRLDVVVGFTSV